MRTVTILVAGLLTLLPLQAASQPAHEGPVLTPAAQPAFERLQALVNQQEVLGADVRVQGIAIAADHAILKLSGAGHQSSVTLRPRGGSENGGRFFAIDPPGAGTPVDQEVLRRLPQALDRSFQTNPWLIPTPPLDPTPAPLPEPATGPSLTTVFLAIGGVLLLVGLLVWV